VVDTLSILSYGISCTDSSRLDAYGLESIAPDKSLLPANIRRRTSLTTRLAVTAAVHACAAANIDKAKVPSVFASIGGEIQVTDSLCMLLPDRQALLSPTQFHNSVHNTTAGYWSVVSGSREPTTAVAAEYDTFAMGMLESWIQARFLSGPLLLVCYDEEWPQYLAPPIGQTGLACALVLSSDRDPNALAEITMPQRTSDYSRYPPGLETFVKTAPAAAAIPLLKTLQSGKPMKEVPLSLTTDLWVADCQAPTV